MQQLKELLERVLTPDFVSATLSNPRKKEGTTKVRVRPIEKKGELLFQCEEFRNNQAFHQNLPRGKCVEALLTHMENMRQMQLETRTESVSVLASKKGKMTIKGRKNTCCQKQVNLSHNKEKSYILQEGRYVAFLEDLGVMTKEGKIVKSRFDKFKQINRFLEFIEDILPQLSKEKEITILDFGCGKSYLTFAVYYYLHELKQMDVRIIGLDLKKEVIKTCNKLAEKYGYEKLTFLEGDIADYEGVKEVDMVITLHACDTATDYALAKAVKWNAKVILSVPCCQHELNSQIQCPELELLLKYGLIKERMASLITDAMRAEYLVREGYEAQILEFIDMEHTPKNILIRAVKTAKKKDNNSQIKRCEAFLNISPTLARLLDERDNK